MPYSIADPLSANLESLLGGQGGIIPEGLSSQDVNSLALLQAMQGVQDVSTKRTASPIGAIAQNLIPIFAAQVQAKRIEQEQFQRQFEMKVALASLLSKEDPEKRKADIARIQAQTEKYKAETAKAQRPAAVDPMKGLPAGVRAEMSTDPAVHEALQREDRRAIRRGVAIEQAKMSTEAAQTGAILRQLGLTPPSAAAPGATTQSDVIGGQQGPTYGAPSFHVSGGKLSVVVAPEKPAKPTQRELEIGAATQTVAGMRPLAEEALATGYGGKPMPDYVPGIAYKANAYLAGKKATEGGVGNFIAQQVYGNPDPKFDDYFTKIGQFEGFLESAASAMTSRGGKFLVEEISKHLLHLANQPRQNRVALKNLYDPNGIVAQRILPEIPKLLRSRDISVEDVGAIMRTFDLIKRDDSGKRMLAVDDKGNVIGKAINGKTYALPPDAVNWGQ